MKICNKHREEKQTNELNLKQKSIQCYKPIPQRPYQWKQMQIALGISTGTTMETRAGK